MGSAARSSVGICHCNAMSVAPLSDTYACMQHPGSQAHTWIAEQLTDTCSDAPAAHHNPCQHARPDSPLTRLQPCQHPICDSQV